MYLVVRATEKPKLWSLSSVTLESSCENEINKSEAPPHSIRLKVCRTKCIEQMQLRVRRASWSSKRRERSRELIRRLF